MFKLLVIAMVLFEGTSVHQVVIEFNSKQDADVAYEKLIEKNKEVIKLY